MFSQQQAAKVVAASLLTASLLLSSPLPSFAATSSATTTGSTPASLVAPALASKSLSKTTTSSKAAAAVPAEKQAIDTAYKALQEASLQAVAINKDLAGVKLSTKQACLAVDQAQAKAKVAKEEVARVKASAGNAKKLGASYEQ